MELKLLVMVQMAHFASLFQQNHRPGQKAHSRKNGFWAGLIVGPQDLIAAARLADRHQIVDRRHLAENQGYVPGKKCGRQPTRIRSERSKPWSADGSVLPKLWLRKRPGINDAIEKDNLVVDDVGGKAQAQ